MSKEWRKEASARGVSFIRDRRENQEEETGSKTIISLWPSLFKTYGGRFLRGSAIGAIHHIMVQLFIIRKHYHEHSHYYVFILICIDRSINLITLCIFNFSCLLALKY